MMEHKIVATLLYKVQMLLVSDLTSFLGPRKLGLDESPSDMTT